MTHLSRKNPRFDAIKSGASGYSFKQVNSLYKREIEALIKMLIDKSISDESLKHPIRKYLIVIFFAALEYFFQNEARKLVDRNNLDIVPLFSKPASLQKLEGLLKEGKTKGKIIASTYSFVNIDHIDYVFSRLLHLDSFLDYVVKLNDTDQTRFVLDGHPLPIEYEKIRKAYDLRSDIVHGIQDAKISNSRVISLWDNLLNIIDVAVTVLASVSDPELRSTLDSDYEWGVERAKRKAIYKLCSDKIMSKLLQRGQLTLVTDGNRFTLEKIGDNDEVLRDNINWILGRMSREELIVKYRDMIKITSKGTKRFKRTTKGDRELWRRNIISDVRPKTVGM